MPSDIDEQRLSVADTIESGDEIGCPSRRSRREELQRKEWSIFTDASVNFLQDFAIPAVISESSNGW